MRPAGASRDRKLYFYDSIADDFDRIANTYDLQRRLEIVFDQLLAGEDLRGKRVLDVGSGTGWFSEAAVARGASVVSIDIGTRLLMRTRVRCGSRPVAGDACALPFASATFDYVVSSECIEHTLAPLQAVHEMARVLVPGGTLVLTTPNWVWRWSATVANALGLRPYEGYEHWVRRSHTRRALEGDGLAIEREVGFHLIPPMLRVTWPLLRLVDTLGSVLAPVMLNVAVKARKRR
jgi:SAM-dependent methyltransferase